MKCFIHCSWWPAEITAGLQLFLCVTVPATIPEEPVLAQASPHLQEPRVQQQCRDKMHSIRWGGSKPSRTVTAQSQGKENSTGFYSESHWRVSAPGGGPSRSYAYMHIRTHIHWLAYGHFCWCSWWAITVALFQTKSRLTSSPPYSHGSKGCFKETLLSKIFYEDRFLCISNQLSKSRDQFKHPSAAQGFKKKKIKSPAWEGIGKTRGWRTQ